MLMDLLSKASTVAMLAFVISSMLAMGVGLSISQIIEPLRNPRLIVFALLSNFVLMPLCAFALSTFSDWTNRWALACFCLDVRPARHSCRSWRSLPKAISHLRSVQWCS